MTSCYNMPNASQYDRSSRLSKGCSSSRTDKEKIEAVADLIHQQWMAMNSWQKNSKPELFLDYKDLSEDEKQKDKDLVVLIQKFKNDKLSDVQIIDKISEGHHEKWLSDFRKSSPDAYTNNTKTTFKERIRKGTGDKDVNINKNWKDLDQAWKTKQSDAATQAVSAYNNVFSSRSNVNPTAERVQLGGRKAVVYQGPRGGKYVKTGGEYVSLSKAMSGGKKPKSKK